MSKGYVEIAAVGDTAPGLEPPQSLFKYVEEPLRSADIRFAQVERLFSERGGLQLQENSPHTRLKPHMATAYTGVPFDVLSLGSNHVGGWGPEAAADSADVLRSYGIASIGVGANLAEARKPAIIEREGFRIAFLGYTSVLLPQFWATEDRGGAVPMRARTYYEPYEYQPGSPARVITVPEQKDLELLQDDVRKAKKEADFVIVCLHWGVHWVPRPLADYQPIVAHAAVDAGANALFGSHPHVMQAVELYKNAPIFYSLGNFSFNRAAGSHQWCLPNCEYTFDDVYSKDCEPTYRYKYDRFRMEGGIAFTQFDGVGLKKVAFRPTMMNQDRRAVPVAPEEPKFEEIRKYLLWVSEPVKGGIRELPVENDRFVVFER